MLQRADTNEINALQSPTNHSTQHARNTELHDSFASEADGNLQMAVMDWLQANSAAVSALASLVTALATIVLMATTMIFAWLTGILAKETRSLRRAGTEPDVVAYLLPHPVHLIVMNIVVANVGQGPARNVEVEFDADPQDFSSHGVRYPARVRRRIAAVLPQGERYIQLFGAGEDLHKPAPMKDFSIHVYFTDSKGISRRTTSWASITEFEGYGGFDPPEYEMAQSLKKMADKLDAWSSGMARLKIETITQKEQREADRELRERIKEAQEKRKNPPA